MQLLLLPFDPDQALIWTYHLTEPTGSVSAAATSAHTMADSQASRDDVLAIATQEQRVCSLPQPWKRLYDLRPGKSRVGAG